MSDESAYHNASGCLMIGLSGATIDAGEAERIRELDPAGLILFRRNLQEFEQARALVDDFVGLVSRPPLIAIDQEGGRVSRLEGWVGPTLTARQLSERPVEQTREFGGTTGRALRCLGVNLDFAPVADLSAADSQNGIGDRAFATDPRIVARSARAFLDGLQESGVAGCLKHFPGLGDTSVDSHLSLPTVRRDRTRLEREDLLPYRELGNLPASVMVGHGHYPAFDGDTPLPATMSRRIVTEQLRGRLGYRGLVVSDDMEMGAIADLDRDGEAGVAAIRAGCDLLLYCADLERASITASALADAATSDPELDRRLRDASSRVASFARRWSLEDTSGRTDRWESCVESFAPFRA
jgi:beta-N-acetylhexosaminidase